MSSRMERYNDNAQINSLSRSVKNEHIYNSLDINELSRIKTNSNVSVISDGTKEINLEKIKKYIYSNDEFSENKRKITLDIPEVQETEVERTEIKNYDINAVLERARGKREVDYENERHRKVMNTGSDIIEKYKKHNETIEDVDDDELNTEEKTIVNLINTIALNKKEDLFGELMGSHEDTIIIAPIEEEIKKDTIKKELESITEELCSIRKPLDDITQDLLLEKERIRRLENTIIDEKKNSSEELIDNQPKVEKIESIKPSEELTGKISNIDKSFFTNSLSFSKNDFDGFDDLEKSVHKSNNITKVAIIIVIIVLLATIAIVANYVFDLGFF